jgi:hypothetical protein
MVLQPFVVPWPLLSFRILFYTVGRTPWTSDQPVARPATYIQNKKKKRGRLCRVTAASFYVNTSVRVERNKFGV